jgi:hypothetical protein
MTGLIKLNQSRLQAMREGNKMIDFLGTITAIIILAYLMRGAYFIVQDAQKRWEDRNK